MPKCRMIYSTLWHIPRTTTAGYMNMYVSYSVNTDKYYSAPCVTGVAVNVTVTPQSSARFFRLSE